MAKQKKVKEKQIVKKPLENPKPDCGTGYYWNGTRCVKNVG